VVIICVGEVKSFSNRVTLIMPSVCNGHAPIVAAESTELSLAKMVVSYIEKKYRNLDKRKVSAPRHYDWTGHALLSKPRCWL